MVGIQLTAQVLHLGSTEIPLEQLQHAELLPGRWRSELSVTTITGQHLSFAKGSPEQVQQIYNQLQAHLAQRRYMHWQQQALANLAGFSALLTGILQEGEERAVIDVVQLILDTAVALNASDIHLNPGQAQTSIRFRIHGSLQTVGQLPGRVHRNLLNRLKVMAQLMVYREDIPQEGRLRLDSGVELRISVMPTIEGEKAVLRLFNHNTIRTLQELGFSHTLLQSLYTQVCNWRSGLFVVCGPCGSGKTSTLYALLLELLQRQPDSHIVTIEDPVERRLPHLTQIEVSESTGLTFAQGLRSILRQDPNLIMVGEIRDLETAHMAVQAALTGHLVLTTIHASTGVEVLTRLLDMGLEPYQVSSTLRGILTQRLVRICCSICQGQSTGCAACFHTGFARREALGELLWIDEAIQQLLLQKIPTSELRQRLQLPLVASELYQAGLEKYQAGLTTLTEVEQCGHV